MKIQTTKLQEMVARVAKCAGCNPLIPKTEMIAIEQKDGVLQFITTDATNYLYVKAENDDEDFYAVVKVEQFSKLIARMTCETTTLSVEGNVLKITGNGTYSIGMEVDESVGGLVKYPNPVASITSKEQIGTMSASMVKTILNSIKPALPADKNDNSVPIYLNYFVGDVVVATDNNKIAVLEQKVLEQPVIISPVLMGLLDIITEDSIEVYITEDNKIEFSTPTCDVLGNLVYNPSDYPTQGIMKCIRTEYPGTCKLPKAQLLQMFDRLSLFVGAFDSGIISLRTKENGIEVMSQQSDGVEFIEYTEPVSEFIDFSCMVNLEMLRAQVKAQTGDVVEFFFGIPSSVKLVDSNTNVVSIVALAS